MNREALIQRFERERREKTAAAANQWEAPQVAMGIAVYDPRFDESVNDTIHRADKIMYEDKRVGKMGR